MTDRRRIPLIYEGRSIQEAGMMRHGPGPRLGPSVHRSREPLAPANRAEAKLASQIAEIERLAGDNHKLASSHVALREDLVAAQLEVQKLRAHLRNIETESDDQIRVLLEKIGKMEVHIKDGEGVKKDLHQAHMEAQGIVRARGELLAQIQLGAVELEKAHADIKKLPVMHKELDALRQEYQRLRTTFQYEKGLNVDKVEKMQAMEKDLVGMAGEVEKLRAEVLNAENRARAPSPYQGLFMHSSHVRPPPLAHGNGPYGEHYGTPHELGHTGAGIGPQSTTGATVWGGGYDAPAPPV